MYDTKRGERDMTLMPGTSGTRGRAAARTGMILARLTRLVLGAAISIAAASPALAQCAMCSVSKGDSPAATRALLAGALVLIIPTVGIIGGFLYLTWKFRDPGN